MEWLAIAQKYKYEAVFGRINYNWEDKYLINLTGRRDGSSRFGSGKQFGNFGAIGAAWIFSNENFIQKNFDFLSFGKIRGSYGTTGNDGIPDYQYLDLYSVTYTPYGGIHGLSPTNLANPSLVWEIDKKLEGGLELGFLKDRIFITANYFRNRSGNQLVVTPVSFVTGFNSIQENLPALVQNSGTEWTLKTINVKSKNFNWSSSINLTIARNKLISFPNLANSTYSNTLVIGQPINILKLYHSLGVNDTTGIYQFASSQGAPTYTPDPIKDVTSFVNRTPKYYGGFQNSLRYKRITLDFFFQFVKQIGQNLLGAYYSLPGGESNMPVAFLNRWQKPGDKAIYQQFSQTFSYASPVYQALQYAHRSDFAYSDASYIRLKNIAISWQLPDEFRNKLGLQNARIYLQAQNLFTITHYQGIDPESQGLGLPPLRVVTAGIQITL
ncbi:MAG: hypothetical protein WDM78_08305 [Puia sp.]